MSNITSTLLERITNRSELNTNDYYLVKDRIERRRDYTGYFLTRDEIRIIIGMIEPTSMVFRKIWQRIPRTREQDAYNQWVHIRTWNQNNPNNQINDYLLVNNNNLRAGNVLIYSLGEMQQYFNDIDTPDISYQYFQQRQRRNKLHEEIKENNENETMKNEDDGVEDGYVPTLQYLARKTVLKNPNLEKYVKDDTNIDIFKIHKKYPGWQQNAGKSKKQRKTKKQQKTKRQRKIKKTRK